MHADVVVGVRWSIEAQYAGMRIQTKDIPQERLVAPDISILNVVNPIAKVEECNQF